MNSSFYGIKYKNKNVAVQSKYLITACELDMVSPTII